MEQPNALCSDLSSGVSIKTLEECQNAVPYIKSEIQGIPNQVNTENSEYYPKGCYAYQAFGIYFNTHESGSRQQDSREVCIAPGKYYKA